MSVVLFFGSGVVVNYLTKPLCYNLNLKGITKGVTKTKLCRKNLKLYSAERNTNSVIKICDTRFLVHT